MDDMPVCGEYREVARDELTQFGLVDPPVKWRERGDGSDEVRVERPQLPVLELQNPDEVLTTQQKGKE